MSLPGSKSYTGSFARWMPADATSDAALSRGLLRVVDLGLLSILFVAPLFMGGRHPAGHLVYVVLCVATAIAWLAHQLFSADRYWIRSSAELVILAAVLLVAVQLVPLPESLLGMLAPQRAEMLSLWQADAPAATGFSQWSLLSLTPESTRGGLTLLISYGMLFLVAVQRLRRLEDIDRLLKAIAIAAVAMAVLGLAQYLTSNGRFVWIYEHPYRHTDLVVKGSFVNRNHFAHFLILGFAPLAVWAASFFTRGGERAFSLATANRREQALCFALVAALAVVLFAVVVTFSRGGIITLAISLVVTSVLLFRESMLTKRIVCGIALVTVLLAGSLSIYGYQRLEQRLGVLVGGDLDQIDLSGSRRNLWDANVQAFRQSPWVGYGIGSHREIYPPFYSEYSSVEFTHAENGFLQIATEAGLAGFVLLLSGIFLVSRWCWKGIVHATSKRARCLAAAIAAGMLASLAHSLVDFVWYIPACITITLLLAAAAQRLSQLADSGKVDASRQTSRLPTMGCAIALALVATIGAWMTLDRWQPAEASKHWDSYLEVSAEFTERGQERTPVISAVDKEEALQRRRQEIATMDQLMQQHLTAVLRCYPNHARANLRLAAICLRQFDRIQMQSDNAMDISQFREAAIASNFESREALDAWLERAVGSHRLLLNQALWHARKGLGLCPLQGEGYLYLTELCFLEGAKAETKAAYVDQALRVRPHHGSVRLAAGREAVLIGEPDKAIEHWKFCFQNDPPSATRLVRLLAGRVPIEFFLTSFEPDLAGLRRIFLNTRDHYPKEQLQPLLLVYAPAAAERAGRLTGREAGRAWMETHRIYYRMGDMEHARLAVETAVTCVPNDVGKRFTYAKMLVETKEMDEAERQLRWCLSRYPGNQDYQKLLTTVVTIRVDGRPQTTQANKTNEGVFHNLR